MSSQIKVAFASGPDDLNTALIERMSELYPELPLYVVSEFPPHCGRWIPYHVARSFAENRARCAEAWRGKRIRLAGVLLVPRMPYRRMRLIALMASPAGFLGFNENLDSFMLRPRSAGAILRHLIWRTRNFLRWQLNPGGQVYTFFWRLFRPEEWRRPWLRTKARAAGIAARTFKVVSFSRPVHVPPELPVGITVVIPSRDGRELLECVLPGVLQDLEGAPHEVIVVDNGSTDDSQEFLHAKYPQVRCLHSAEPLSFARAVNRGIDEARYSFTCLLNNDMVIEPGFFPALHRAFEAIPNLFSATAQIFFPQGARREETGKAVMAQQDIIDFPVRCDEPVAGEDHTYVLYGSGGCTLYDTRRLRALGAIGEVFEPAYVEDLDVGYRAWQRGWPTVFVAGARVEHRHRATTSRFYSAEELSVVLEQNYIRFLCRSVASGKKFASLWKQAIRRLDHMALAGRPEALPALDFAAEAPHLVERTARCLVPEDEFLALTAGDVAVFPGKGPRVGPAILVVSPYLPFPLSHGGAVRMYNLMQRASAWTQVLVCFSPELAPPAPELLALFAEIVIVRLQGSHSRPSTVRPEVVEEFDSPAFHAAVRQTVRKWRPRIAQLEFTQMAQYAADCHPARTVLVEHDITLDLYEQLHAMHPDWETARQLERWRRFEPDAWRRVDTVVTMSEKDRKIVTRGKGFALGNGVDLERFRPSEEEFEPGRLLFIGSFAHLPNLLALDFFLREVWPDLRRWRPFLHVIAGARHEFYLDHYRDRVVLPLPQQDVAVEGFVSDVRPAYHRAQVVIAPLIVSAGTNIKIMEAMAMGKAIVSTPAGVNGLDIEPGQDVLIAASGREMAEEIGRLLESPERCYRLGTEARRTAEQRYNWDEIAKRQTELYERLSG